MQERVRHVGTPVSQKGVQAVGGHLSSQEGVLSHDEGMG